MVRVAACLLIMALIYRDGYAQPANLVRLRSIVQDKQVKKDCLNDSSYIDALNNLAFAYYRISADSLFIYGNKALAGARKLGYGKGESNALRLLGNGYRLTGHFTNVLSSYHQALAVAEKIDNHNLIAKASINIALLYSDMGKQDEALVLAERSRRLFEETKDSLDLIKSLTLIGAVWQERKQNEKALQYDRQALALSTAMKDKYLVLTVNDEIGVVLLAQGHYKEALDGYLQSYNYFRHSDDKIRFSVAARMMAKSNFRLGHYREALKYALQGEQAAVELKGKAEMKDAFHVLGDIYGATGDYRNATKYLRKYNELSDTLFNDQLLKNTAKLEASYEYEKKETALREQQAEKDAVNREIVRNKELEIYVAILAILLLSVLAFVLFRSRAARQKTNRILEARNTEIHRQKEKIESHSLQLLLNNQQKDKLFGIISHDLKTPLHSLHTVLDLLKANALSETQLNQVIEELRHEVDYSSELVGNLLSWSRSQLNGMVAKPVSLDLRALTGEVLQLCKTKATQKQIVMGNLVHPSLQGYADKDMMHVIIRNLVFNAIKFCEINDAIVIDGKTTDDGIEICVSDTGTGMKEDILDKINRRKIVTTYGTAGEKGTGLGLLLCREFIELNHGLLRVESEPGQGSRCFFTLPLPPHSA